MSTAVDEARSYLIQRNTFCAEEEAMFYSCVDAQGTHEKERLRSILFNKRALFDKQYLLERTAEV